MPSRLLGTRWALTPPFHPYQALSPSAIRLRGLRADPLKVFLQPATEAHCTGGLFSVALSVAEPMRIACASREDVSPLALPGALPFRLERLAPRIFIPDVSPQTTVSGLSSRPAFLRRPAQRSPGLPANSYYTSIHDRKGGQPGEPFFPFSRTENGSRNIFTGIRKRRESPKTLLSPLED